MALSPRKPRLPRAVTLLPASSPLWGLWLPRPLLPSPGRPRVRLLGTGDALLFLELVLGVLCRWPVQGLAGLSVELLFCWDLAPGPPGPWSLWWWPVASPGGPGLATPTL